VLLIEACCLIYNLESTDHEKVIREIGEDHFLSPAAWCAFID